MAGKLAGELIGLIADFSGALDGLKKLHEAIVGGADPITGVTPREKRDSVRASLSKATGESGPAINARVAAIDRDAVEQTVLWDQLAEAQIALATAVGDAGDRARIAAAAVKHAAEAGVGVTGIAKGFAAASEKLGLTGEQGLAELSGRVDRLDQALGDTGADARFAEAAAANAPALRALGFNAGDTLGVSAALTRRGVAKDDQAAAAETLARGIGAAPARGSRDRLATLTGGPKIAAELRAKLAADPLQAMADVSSRIQAQIDARKLTVDQADKLVGEMLAAAPSAPGAPPRSKAARDKATADARGLLRGPELAAAAEAAAAPAPAEAAPIARYDRMVKGETVDDQQKSAGINKKNLDQLEAMRKDSGFRSKYEVAEIEERRKSAMGPDVKPIDLPRDVAYAAERYDAGQGDLDSYHALIVKAGDTERRMKYQFAESAASGKLSEYLPGKYNDMERVNNLTNDIIQGQIQIDLARRIAGPRFAKEIDARLAATPGFEPRTKRRGSDLHLERAYDLRIARESRAGGRGAVPAPAGGAEGAPASRLGPRADLPSAAPAAPITSELGPPAPGAPPAPAAAPAASNRELGRIVVDVTGLAPGVRVSATAAPGSPIKLSGPGVESGLGPASFGGDWSRLGGGLIP